jgi:pimeloyl-ACP methyl ester carboxylesterase
MKPPFAIATLATLVTTVACTLALPRAVQAQQPSQTADLQEEAHTPGDLDIERRTLETANGREIDADFGRFWVPERRANPNSNVIELAFVRLKSTTDDAGAPIVYLAGGPGQGSTPLAQNPNALTGWARVLEAGDVIFLDQRATGASRPWLVRISPLPVPEDAFVDADAALERAIAGAKEAADYFRAQAVDLAGYTTVEAADDIDALRRALGLEKISLFGFSYGTHLAQATMKRHGEHLENVVMIGVEGLDETYKLPLNLDTQFRKLSLMVAEDERVAPHVPDLMALLERVLDKLEREPMAVTIRHPGTGQPIDVKVGKFGLQMILRFDIGDASDLPVFPKLLHSIDQGDPTLLTWFVQKRYGMLLRNNVMSAMTDAASGASPARLAMIEEQAEQSLFGKAANFPFPAVGEAIGAPDLGEEFRAPFVSDVRTLLLSGSLDWNTPPYQAEKLKFGLSNATHLSVENAGHEQILRPMGPTIVRFLMGEDVSDVKVALPPLRFVPIDEYDSEVTHPSVPRG